MLNLRVLSVASAAFTIFSSANAGLLKRNQEPPQPSCVDFTPFTYSGCFRDPPSPGPHALLYTSGLDSQNMTIEKCVAFCKGNDYRYAGLEYYGECTCGASIYGDQIDESYCSYPCTANKTETCGGSDAVSVYQDPTFKQVGNYTDISDYKPIGCYTEGTNGRSLAWRQDDVAEATLTIEKCLTACKKGGYSIAGVEYGQECYCGVVLGNGTVSAPSTDCDMPCNGALDSEICGGRSRLNLFVADDLESSEPCKDGPVTSSTTSVPSSTSTTPTSSTSSTDSSTITTSSSSSTSTTSSTTSSTSSSTIPSTSSPTTRPPTTSPPTTSTTKTTASLCTSTYTIKPTPTCEYKCGSWCSTPMPTWSDQTSCFKAQQNCAVQIAACFLNAGWPDNLQCFDFAKWCGSVSSYCSNYCPGNNCSKPGCRSKYPPQGPPQPSASVSTSVYTCPVSSTKTTSRSTSTTQTCVPIPTNTNICVQPHNPNAGYTSTSPVGNIPLPCLTCNNLWSDYRNGNPFKLYAFADSSSCSSYPRTGSSGPYKACRDACDKQYQSCMSTYAQGCKNKSDPKFTDSYSVASKKCSDQRQDCYNANANVNPSSSRCNSWNSGWW